MVPEFACRTVDYIESQSSTEKPFFLYLPLTSPHSPVVLNEAFKGMSGISNYGDFVCEVDGWSAKWSRCSNGEECAMIR
jgi:arylsulfatase A